MASAKTRPGRTGPEATVPETAGAAADSELAEADLPESAMARVILSRKELARHYRQQAYQKAKAWRAQDPKHLAMKEAVKVRRRAVYQEAKARRKEADSREKEKRAAKQADERQAARNELGSKLRRQLKGDRQACLDPVAEVGTFTPELTSHPTYALLESESDGQSQDSLDPQRELRSQQRDLHSELQNALKNKRVSELMQRVRRASEDARLIANTVSKDTSIDEDTLTEEQYS